MPMSSNLKFTLGIVAAAVIGVAAAAVIFSPDEQPLAHTQGEVALVEFLDFQCGPCGAAFPNVERVRKEYGGRITYTAKMFPIPSHRHAQATARAALAAGNQGRFDDMYRKLFETQAVWSPLGADQAAATFAGYARELGLDMKRYQADVASGDTGKRITADVDQGIAAGVNGTPTFFINGKRFTGSPTYDGLKAAIDAELAKVAQ